MGKSGLKNSRLVNYGIHTEKSDWRIHVCVLARRVYAFPREAALPAVRRRALKGQDGHKQIFTPTIDGPIMTATGYAIPVTEIDPIYGITVPPGWLGDEFPQRARITIHKQMDTAVKGQKAERLVRNMWNHGYLNFLRPLSIQEVRSLGQQISGIDLKIVMPSLQIKCDFRGGEGQNCTGNLFIQLSECNPFERH